MKKTGIKAAIFVVLAVTVLAGEAFAGPGRGGRGRGGGQGWGRGMTGGPRMGANFQPAQPDNSWVPGPYCPFGQGPNQNIRGRQGRGPGGFGQGFGRRDMMMQRRPMAGRGGRGAAMQGRGGRGYQGRGAAIQGRGYRGYQGRGFQRRDIAPQAWGMNGRQRQFRPGGIGRPGPGMQPRRFTLGDMDQPTQPRGRDWTPGWGQGRAPGWGQGWAPGWGQGWGPNPQPEKAPDTNTPAEPVVKGQTEKPQDE